jgi:hypothetical protein
MSCEPNVSYISLILKHHINRLINRTLFFAWLCSSHMSVLTSIHSVSRQQLLCTVVLYSIVWIYHDLLPIRPSVDITAVSVAVVTALLRYDSPSVLDWIFVSPSKFICQNPNSQCHGIRRWWEWSPNERDENPPCDDTGSKPGIGSSLAPSSQASQPPELWETNTYCLKHSVWGTLLQRFEVTKTEILVQGEFLEKQGLFLLLFAILGVEPKASHLQGIHSTTSAIPTALCFFLIFEIGPP